MRFTVVAEYHENPAEGINVVSKMVIDELRSAGHEVRVFPPSKVLIRLLALILDRSPNTVFTHGPGVRTVFASRILRALSPTRITWVATRPDVANCPAWLKGGKSAHIILCNRPRADLAECARDAQIVPQLIGIAPERMKKVDGVPLWSELRRPGVPIAVHVGHLRRSRGLERLIETKRLLGDRIEIVVQASPYFEPAVGLSEELTDAGVHLARAFVPSISEIYRSADLYLFPAPPDQDGAIELPLSVLEAIACGTPVISTEFGALPDALEGVPGVQFVSSTGFAAAVAKWVDQEQPVSPEGLPQRLHLHRLVERILEWAI
jgi:glycosyltransferase involved in cell wall biosynthesis